MNPGWDDFENVLLRWSCNLKITMSSQTSPELINKCVTIDQIIFDILHSIRSSRWLQEYEQQNIIGLSVEYLPIQYKPSHEMRFYLHNQSGVLLAHSPVRFANRESDYKFAQRFHESHSQLFRSRNIEFPFRISTIPSRNSLLIKPI